MKKKTLRICKKKFRFWTWFIVAILGILFGTYPVPADNGNLRTAIVSVLQQNKCPVAGSAIVIRELGCDTPAVALFGDSAMVPASVQKLVTTAIAFEKLKITYTFKTNLYYSGSFDPDSSIVRGDLYIQGRGDPGFTAERLWLFVQHIRHLGVRRINGDLVLDNSFFDTLISAPGYELENTSRAYGSYVDALSANYNCIGIHQRPGKAAGSPIFIELFPRIDRCKIVNTARTFDASSRSGIDVQTASDNTGTKILVSGGMHSDDDPCYTYRKVWQTWQNFGQVIQTLFAENGITLIGNIRHDTVPRALIKKGPFYSFESVPLASHLSDMCKYSNNFVAEMVFKTIAAEVDTLPGTWERGSLIASAWWKERGLPGTPVIVNGSGMGNKNNISAQQLVALLDYVSRQKSYWPEFLASLPQAGVDGTLQKRFVGSPLFGIVRAKTGTINDFGVSSLAGYMLLQNRTYAFAIIFNYSPQSLNMARSWTAQEKILELFFHSLINTQ